MKGFLTASGKGAPAECRAAPARKVRWGRYVLSGFLAITSSSAHPADVGSGYGETMWALTSARQAGSGGLPLEDTWKQGTLIETSTVAMEPNLRWYGLGLQGGLGSGLRGGAEAFYFGASNVLQTRENPDGTWGGEEGTVDASEFGGRVVGQMTVVQGADMAVAALARATGSAQVLPGEVNGGMGLEVGGQMRQGMGPDSARTFWGMMGPIGRGAGRWYTGQFNVGAAIIQVLPRGLLGQGEGMSLGVEATILAEGLFHGGIGAVYWVGKPDMPGWTFFLRTGARFESGSIESFQPRGGVGTVWRRSDGWGLQFDWAFVPLGPLGSFQYATVGLRLPQLEPPPLPAPEAASPEPEPEKPKLIEVFIHFYPEKGEVARHTVVVTKASRIKAVLMTLEGRTLMTLMPETEVEPGSYEVAWDGLLENGVAAEFGTTYIMLITEGSDTYYVKTMPMRMP